MKGSLGNWKWTRQDPFSKKRGWTRDSWGVFSLHIVCLTVCFESFDAFKIAEITFLFSSFYM